MEKSTPSSLTEREELLLSAFIDDECTSVERAKAEQLIKANPAARAFIETIKTVTSEISHARADLGFESVNLWDRVSARMDQEERTALFLGTRQTAMEDARASHAISDRRSFASALASWFDMRMAFGGLSGAAVAACALIVLNGGIPSFMNSPRTGNSRVAIVNPNGEMADQVGLNTVALGSNLADPSSVARVRPRFVDNSIRSVEVDWARGDGPMNFIQGPNDRSAIIWVKRRRKNPTASSFRQNSLQKNVGSANRDVAATR